MSCISTKVLSIKKDSFIAEISIPFLAIIATIVRVSDRTNSDNITNFNLSNLLSYQSNLTNDLMPGTTRIIALTPVLSDRCQIWMANWCVKNFKSNLMFFRLHKCEWIHNQGRRFTCSYPCDTVCFVHSRRGIVRMEYLLLHFPLKLNILMYESIFNL